MACNWIHSFKSSDRIEVAQSSWLKRRETPNANFFEISRAAGRRVGGSAGGSADPRVGSGSAPGRLPSPGRMHFCTYCLSRSWLVSSIGARPFDHKSSRDA